MIEAISRQGRAILLAFLLVGVAYVIRWLLAPVLLTQAPFLLFVVPVVVAVVISGRGAGLAAGTLSLAAGFSFEPRELWWTPQIIVQAGIFILVCAGIGWLGERLAGARSRARQAQTEAEQEATKARGAGEQLQLLLEGASGYAIFMVSPDGIIRTWNKASERVFGWKSNQVLGRHSSILYSADGNGQQRADADLAEALDGRSSKEIWLARSDGSEFLADVTITPVHDNQGRHQGYAEVVHDATERHAAAAALASQERHLQSILATVPDAMIVIDEAGLILSFSATAERLFGYSEKDVVGKNVSLLMPSPDRERHDSYIQRYLKTGVPRIIGIGRVVTGLRADGRSFPMKLSVGEAQLEDQRIFTGFVQDLTETRNFEARLDELKSELIHVSRLSAMGTMASTLAHELNQPLTAIANYGEAAASLLESGDELDRGTLGEILSEMAEQSLRAGGVVRRLREFVARGEVNKAIEELPKLINEASALALVGSRQKGIESHFAFDPEATPVLADRVQIQQVLINLMRNAVEAMEDCDPRRLSVRTSLLDPRTVEIVVADSGPGIAPEIREQLFQAFSSTKKDGMGLGLSICRTIVEAHGGRIAARPAEGGGTEFAFTLPRAIELVDDDSSSLSG